MTEELKSYLKIVGALYYNINDYNEAIESISGVHLTYKYKNDSLYLSASGISEEFSQFMNELLK